MNDQLHAWEKAPIIGLFAAQGAYIWEWYIANRMPPEIGAGLGWVAVMGGLAAVAAIDGAMIATVAGMRLGRRSGWSVAAIALTAAFGALVALHLHGAIPDWVGAWLHAGFAATIATYLLHLAQPAREPAGIHDALADAHANLAGARGELAATCAELARERGRPVLTLESAAQLLITAGAPEATIRNWRERGRLQAPAIEEEEE